MIEFTKLDPSIDREEAIKQLCERYILLEFVFVRMIIGQKNRTTLENQISELRKVLAEKQKEYKKLTTPRVVNENEEVSVFLGVSIYPIRERVGHQCCSFCCRLLFLYLV